METDLSKFSARAGAHLMLIRPDPVEKKRGNIVLAVDEKLERGATTSGTVLSVGPEAFLAFQQAAGIPMAARTPWCQVGDHIYYAKYAGKWIDDKETGEALLFVRDEDYIGHV